MALTKDLHCRKIVVATDCQGTMNNLRGETLGAAKTIIFEVKKRMQEFVSAEILHEKRDFNVEAHSLAKAPTSLNFGRHVLVD